MTKEEQLAKKRERARLYYAQNKDRIKANTDKYRKAHQEEVRGRLRRWRDSNIDKVRSDRIAIKEGLRDRVYALLGYKCSRCGITDRRVLHIDHINGDGKEKRDRGNGRRKTQEQQFRDMLCTNGEGLQLLCANCHMITEWERRQAKRATTTKEV